MVKLNFIYYFTHFFNLSKHFAIICIVLFVTVQPTVELLFDLIDVDYELCEKYDEDDLEQKEKLKEKKGKEDKFYLPRIITTSRNYYFSPFKARRFNNFDHINTCLDFKQEVPSPPPEFA